MGTPAVVPNVDPPQEQAGLGRSTIRFPYLDLNDAIDMAKNIFEVGGKSCEKIALAAQLNVSADGGGFNLRVGTAKMFGLISGEKKTISLTDLGVRILDPSTEKAARAESFLQVPLYKAIYNDYQGQILPANPALEAHIEKLGVAPKQKDKARQVFQRSATEAGFFSVGNNRLVAPQMRVVDTKPLTDTEDEAMGSAGAKNAPPPPPPPPQGPQLPPYVQVLVSKLPAADTKWGMTGRKKWLEAALKIFDLMYEADPEDAQELNITFATNSAK